jgi:hypothetical protein
MSRMLSFHLSCLLKLGSSSRLFCIFPQFASWFFSCHSLCSLLPFSVDSVRTWQFSPWLFCYLFSPFTPPPVSYELLHTKICFAFLFYLTLNDKIQNRVFFFNLHYVTCGFFSFIQKAIIHS